MKGTKQIINLGILGLGASLTSQIASQAGTKTPEITAGLQGGLTNVSKMMPAMGTMIGAGISLNLLKGLGEVAKPKNKKHLW